MGGYVIFSSLVSLYKLVGLVHWPIAPYLLAFQGLADLGTSWHEKSGHPFSFSSANIDIGPLCKVSLDKWCPG